MQERTVKILEEKRVYDGYTKVDEALIEDTLEDGSSSQYIRQKITRPDAVTGLIYNIDTECVVLVKQHRYPTQKGRRVGFTYEAVAGKIDEIDNDPKKTFMRECLEETGYKVKEKNVEFCFWCFASPGYSTERVHYFIATVRNRDKVADGGGIKTENENIEICEIHYLQFRSMMDTMEDAKTKLLAYEAHHRGLFDRN